MTRRRKVSRDLQNMPSNNKTQKNIEAAELRGPTNISHRGNGLANDVRNIGNNLFREVVMPAAKSTFMDFINNGLSELIFGESNAPTRRRGNHYSYNKQYRRSTSDRDYGYRRDDRRQPPRRRGSRRAFSEEDLYFTYREDAQYVLGQMINTIAEYGIVTVGDLYNFGNQNSSPVHEQWGWDDLQGVRVEYAGSRGFLIGFPDPFYLE